MLLKKKMSWKCNHCGETKGQMYGDLKSNITFCSHCWELLLKEKLPPKVADKRLKITK